MPMRCGWAMGRWGAAAALLVLGLCLAGLAARAAPTPWVDPATGLALGGYDPLAYFTRRAPRRGSEDQELIWRGVVWRFRNAGNRAAFALDPDVYAPRFSGYDPTSVAAGKPAQGHPAIWAIHAGRLYLFHDAASRQTWARDPDGVVGRAAERWPEVSRRLPGNSVPDQPRILPRATAPRQ